MMRRVRALVVFFAAASANAVTVKSRPCSGGVEAARLQVDVVRPAGGEARSLSRIKLIERGSKVIYKPVSMPQELKNNAKVALVVGPAGGERDVPTSLSILEFKPAASTAEWAVPFRVGLAVFVLGPQGLDEKRVSTLVMRDEELIGALADYAANTREIEDTVEALTAIEEDEGSELDEAASRLNRTNPTEQALYTLLRAISPTLLANNPLGGGKRIGPVTLMNKASEGFFENAGGLFPGGGALTEIKPFLFPDTDFRAAFVQHVGTSLAFCVPRLQAKSRNRQVYVWASRIINQTAPQLSWASSRRVPIGAVSPVPVKPAKTADWRFVDRVDSWTLTPLAGGETLPVKVRQGSVGRSLEIDLRGFPGGAGKYRLAGEWDWTRFPVTGDLELMPLGDLKAVRIPTGAQELIAGRGVAVLPLEGADFQFIEKVALMPAGGQLELANPLQFVLAQGRRGGLQQRMDVEIDTSALRPGGYVLALQQADGRPQEIPVTVQASPVQIDNLPLKLANGSQRLILKGSGLDRLRSVEIAGADVTLEPAGPSGAERAATITVRDGRKGDRVEAVLQVNGSDQKRWIAAAVELMGPRPRIVRIAAQSAGDLGVELREGELPAGSFTSFSILVESSEPVSAFSVACNGVTAKLLAGGRDTWGSAAFTSPANLFLTIDPGSKWAAGCTLTASVQGPDGLSSDPARLGTVVRIPKLESISFSGDKLPDGNYAAVLTGQDLEVIEKAGWDAHNGVPVGALPAPGRSERFRQTLKMAMPWPSPSPRSPVYVWLRGETDGRKTQLEY